MRSKPKCKRKKRTDRRPKSGRRDKPAGRQIRSNSGRIKLIARFLGVGLINTVFGYAIYALLILFNMPYLGALLMATIVGVIFNYFSIGRLVFKSKSGAHTFAKFIAAYGVVYCINATTLKLLINNLQINPYIGQALCIPLSVLISWFLMNYWVFKNDEKR